MGRGGPRWCLIVISVARIRGACWTSSRRCCYRGRSAQERTAAAYTARVAGFAEWLPAPIDQSLRKLTAATVVEWVNLEAARELKASTLGKQLSYLRVRPHRLVMLRSFLLSPFGRDRSWPEWCATQLRGGSDRSRTRSRRARSKHCSARSTCVRRKKCGIGRSCSC